MIYITGDTHGDYTRINDKKLSHLGKDDYLIISGDFGFVFAADEKGIRKENKRLDEMEKLNFNIIFLEGNHDNYLRICSFPEVEKFANKCHKIRNNIYHLERGRAYTIQGKKFFVLGGAASMDIYKRTPYISWWKEELPSKQEYERAVETLKEHGYIFDYILTHTAPIEAIKILGFNPYLTDDMELTSFLSYIMESCCFECWYFGHFHTDETFEYSKTNIFSSSRTSNEIDYQTKHFRALLNDFVKIE